MWKKTAVTIASLAAALAANAGGIFFGPLPLQSDGRPMVVFVTNQATEEKSFTLSIVGPEAAQYRIGPTRLVLGPSQSGRVRILPARGFVPQGTEAIQVLRNDGMSVAFGIRGPATKAAPAPATKAAPAPAPAAH